MKEYRLTICDCEKKKVDGVNVRMNDVSEDIVFLRFPRGIDRNRIMNAAKTIQSATGKMVVIIPPDAEFCQAEEITRNDQSDDALN